MYNLFFNNQYDENEFIVNCIEKDIMKNIKEFVKRINPNFKIYYIRSWIDEDDKIWYDVGSHNEFFFAEFAKEVK